MSGASIITPECESILRPTGIIISIWTQLHSRLGLLVRSFMTDLEYTSHLLISEFGSEEDLAVAVDMLVF